MPDSGIGGTLVATPIALACSLARTGGRISAPARSPNFGALLRQHRLALGLTQEALAERAGLSWRTVQDLERGVARPCFPLRILTKS